MQKMGRIKRNFNKRGRQIVDDADIRKAHNVPCVELDLPSADKKSQDALVEETQNDWMHSNALVLPSKKKANNKKKEPQTKLPRKLSNKQRKRLQKVLDKKEKKSKREDILASLVQHQASKQEMSMFASAAHLGQKATKRQLAEKMPECIPINSLKGVNRRKRRKLEEAEKEMESELESSDDESDEVDGDGHENDDSKQQGKTEDDAKETDSREDKDVDAPVTELVTEGSPSLSSSAEMSKKDEEVSKKTSEKDKSGKTRAPENRTPAVFVYVDRKPEIQAARLALPILAEEQVIMEAINEHQVVILCGETGSGKTTQVPQFLYEAGYAQNGLIGITEPRRVAAITMSERVAMEMGLSTSVVSYMIRYQGNVTTDTKIKFMTDGVLLKEIQKDFLLTKYSVIVIDEAHERSVYTDILIGLLSRIVPLRNKKGSKMKLIIMSATLRVEDFTENQRLFKTTPPVIKVESRQFPVTVHFNKRTPVENYMAEAERKVLKIHRTLPPGGILVFVTGQNEVSSLCRKLRARNKKIKAASLHETSRKRERGGEGVSDEEEAENVKEDEESMKAFRKQKLPKISLDNYSVQPYEEEEVDELKDEEGNHSESEFQVAEPESEDDMLPEEDLALDGVPLYVLPMYSLLAPHQQAKVFQAPPEDARLCVVATNVAETSLTIPGIKYVVDTGRVKKRYYDKVTGVSSFKITWTSKASANQRAGRAGRTEPGHCYRLYSSAVFASDFETFDPAEITRRPVDDLTLQMKDMGIDKVVNFPFPTPPEPDALKAAERLLISLGALEVPPKRTGFSSSKEESFSTRITPMGKMMACFPVSPCYARMIAIGQREGCLPYIIALVSALTVREIFEVGDPQSEDTEELKDEQKRHRARVAHSKRQWAGVGESQLLGDLMVMLGAVGATEFAGCTPSFCAAHGLRYKAMVEIRRLRRQLTNAVNSVQSDYEVVLDPKMNPPSGTQVKLLRQIVLAGMPHHVARKMPETEEQKEKNAYQSVGIEGAVYIHPDSVLAKKQPEFVVYQEVIETSRPYMRGVVAIEPEWLPVVLPHLCTFSKPMEQPAPSYNEETGTVHCHMTSTFGRNTWQVPAVELEYPKSVERFKWFARFLLEGKVIPGLKDNTSFLLSSPSTMIKTWAKLQPRTEILLKTLVAEGVDCKEALIEAWRRHDKYLLSAYCDWLHRDKHVEVMAKWPPIQLD
ncbi:probable ATP-dependent RNA helicase DHX37 isoform X2 [Acanthaster planci]|uniref:RNA helicase n=1 Tax=Acanthaster planci TaxID=133434 RepID=A0A8B7Y2Y3_ACAPL|nr:probable ATP-dependent RNA helicase DHX37 isoform X2 [Acanthaster planci]